MTPFPHLLRSLTVNIGLVPQSLLAGPEVLGDETIFGLVDHSFLSILYIQFIHGFRWENIQMET